MMAQALRQQVQAKYVPLWQEVGKMRWAIAVVHVKGYHAEGLPLGFYPMSGYYAIDTHFSNRR